MKKPKKDRGLLIDDAAIDRYVAFIAGGLFGVFVCFAIPALVAFVIKLQELS
jgi:hypothetical protein